MYQEWIKKTQTIGKNAISWRVKKTGIEPVLKSYGSHVGKADIGKQVLRVLTVLNWVGKHKEKKKKVVYQGF